MAAPCFIGDDLSAAGWRLAGFRTLVPQPHEVEQTVRQALPSTPLLVMTGEIARQLPPLVLEQTLASLSPLVLVVPGMRSGEPALDVAARVRAQLGLTT